MPTFSLEPLDLAALLCSRVCHDVISPVGAIVNGLEVLDEAKDADTRGFAIDLIKTSAHKASARLQYCRLAFGASGSSGASIDTGDAEQVARNLLGDDRTRFDWHAARVLLPKNKVKLILNMCLIAAAAIPRGGVLSVTTDSAGQSVEVSAKGTNAKVAAHVPHLLAGTPDAGTIDAHGIQAYYTSLVAAACDMKLDLSTSPDHVVLTARETAGSSTSAEPAKVA
jgi:histidine phosphotransferase ChpT